MRVLSFLAELCMIVTEDEIRTPRGLVYAERLRAEREYRKNMMTRDASLMTICCPNSRLWNMHVLGAV